MRRRHVKKEFKEEVENENSGCLPYSKKDPNKMTNYYTSVEMDIWHRQYGNTGCGFFKRGGTKLERLLPKNQHTQRNFLNFENWTNGEPQ